MDTGWLDDDQQRAWRQLIAVALQLPTHLDRQLRADAGLTHFAYWVLALLSEADGHRLPLARLAAQADASLSRLSHQIDRLEGRGWVVRRRDPDDARVTVAELTAEGHEVVRAAAPGHVATVRSLVFDHLDDRDVADLERVAQRIAAAIAERRA